MAWEDLENEIAEAFGLLSNYERVSADKVVSDGFLPKIPPRTRAVLSKRPAYKNGLKTGYPTAIPLHLQHKRHALRPYLANIIAVRRSTSGIAFEKKLDKRKPRLCQSHFSGKQSPATHQSYMEPTLGLGSVLRTKVSDEERRRYVLSSSTTQRGGGKQRVSSKRSVPAGTPKGGY
jgi:hypothetical protein